MSFDEQNLNPEVQNAEPAPAAVDSTQTAPAIPQPENLEAPELKDGVRVADASGDEARAWDALEEEEAEEAEESVEAVEESHEDASSDDGSEAEADAGDATAEADGTETGSAEATGGAAASSGGISSAWVWGGLAVAAGAAASASGGDSTPTPEPPTVSLDTDSGAAGDGVTNVATFTVGGLEDNTTWEYSTDGGSTWTTGSG